MHAHRLRAAFTSVAAVLAIAVAAPLTLVAVCRSRLGSAQPLRGLQAPWHWSLAEVRRWAAALGSGFDRSDDLVDLFIRIAVIVAWVCVAVLALTIGREVVFQLRHGMPSSRGRRGPIRAIAGFVAAGLVGVLPAAGAVAPALAAAPVVAVAPAAPSASISASSTALAPAGVRVEVVRPGDSLWSIAERAAGGGDVGAFAQRIVEANVGRTMNDGARFVTGALIEPGWQLHLPTEAPPLPVAAPVETHTVVAGDSYWAISEDHLDSTLLREATNREVLEYVHRMMDRNTPVLHHRDPALIIPGEVLVLPPLSEPPAAAVPVATPPVVEAPRVWAGETATADPRPVPSVVAPPPAEPAIVADLPSAPSPTSASAVPPTVAPTSTAATQVFDDVVAEADDGSASTLVAAASLTLAGGALVLVRRRRRAALRSAGVGARLAVVGPREAEVERALVAARPIERLVRIELGLRVAGAALAAAGDRPLAVLAADDGAIRLITEQRTMPSGEMWRIDLGSDHWILPASIALADLAAAARSLADPCPLLVHLGRSGDAELFVDLEAAGVLCVDVPHADTAAAMVRAIVAAVDVSALAEGAQILGLGPCPPSLGQRRMDLLDEPHLALDEAVRRLGSTTYAVAGTASTFALRMRGGGEPWSPVLIGSIGTEWDGEVAARAIDVADGGGRGVAVVVDRPLAGAGWTVRHQEDGFVLDPLALPLDPIGLSATDLAGVASMVDRSADGIVVPEVEDDRRHVDDGVGWSEPAWDVLVRVLGNVAVETRAGIPVAFDRSKSLELVAWLTQHPERPTRMAARTALWDLDVRDATFANVVSDARRSIARVAELPVGEEWIARTLTEQIPLHRLVTTDAALLASRLEAAANLDDAEAVAVLRPGLELVTAGPFADASFLWPDAEGTTTSLVLLVTSAATAMAQRCLSLGDIDGVFWATGQGLKALPGHEELISLRMRAHAAAGDLSGVRQEWEAYERALATDPWSDDEPAPKLVDLRRRLLAPSMAG